jgi:opacity protein-like surface antigen
MTRLPKPAFHTLLTLCLAILLFVSAPSVMAQTAFQKSSNDNQQEIEFYTGIEFEYSDNIFSLQDSQQSKMAADATEDSKSGRFRDMESISDNIVSPALGMKYNFRGLYGEDLNLSARMKYNYYMENQEKSYPEARILLKHDVGKKGVIVLEGDFLFDFFNKNYLSGYDDENENGNISRDERIYSPAVYDEYEATLAYEYEFFKDNDQALSQVEIKPFFGYNMRSYNSTFDNRGRESSFIGLELTLELVSRIDLELVYQFENARYPGNDELVLYDETRAESDVNEDGEIEGNAPLVTPIDRSAYRHTLEITPSFKISKDFQFYLGYEKRISDYTSDNTLDIDHFDQTSSRQRIKAGLEYDFSKSWSSEIEYRQTKDDGEDDSDYSENCFTFSIKYDLP